MPDHNPTVTDDDRTLDDDTPRAVHEWAKGRRKKIREGCAMPRQILHLLDAIETYVPHPAPPATLAEELREWGARPLGGLNWTRFHDLADRVEAEAKRKDLHADNQRKELARLNTRVKSLADLYSQAETSLGDVASERDEARAEVELLAAQIDRLIAEAGNAREAYTGQGEALKRAHKEHASSLREIRKLEQALADSRAECEAVGDLMREKDTRISNQRQELARLNTEVERLTATFKEPLKEPGHLPDLADVPDGEAWAVNVNGQRRIGIRSDGAGIGYGTAWATSPAPMNRWWVSDEEVTLVSCLVPDTRRVIDRPEDLDKLPVRSVVLVKNYSAWQKELNGRWSYCLLNRQADNLIMLYGPVTVIYEPMSDSADSGDGRTPDCPTQG